MSKFRRLVFFSTFILLLTGCRPDIEFVEGSFRSGPADVTASGGNISMIFSSGAGSASVDLKASGKWSATFVNDRAGDWCSLSTSSGKRGTATITVSVTENKEYDDRSASINFVCGDVKRTIVVTQKKKDALLLTSTRQDVVKEGGRFTVEVKANVSFTYEIAESAKSWIKSVGTKGLTTSTMTFDVAANDSFNKREGEITFTSTAGSEVVKVYQECDTPAMIVSSDHYELPAESGQFDVQVRSNVDVTFEIPSDCDWLRETKTKSMSTNTFHFSVEENESFDDRTASILFKCAEWKLEETVVVTQSAATPVIIIGNSQYEFASEGGNLSIEVTSNLTLDITIEPECDWIDLVETKAITERTYLFSVGKNHSRHDRNAWIVFRNDKLNHIDTVYVSQSFQPILVPCDTLKTSGRGWTVSFETVNPTPNDYRLSIADRWVSQAGQERSAKGIRFFISVAALKQHDKARNAQILVYYKDFAEPDTVWVHQYEQFPAFSYTTTARNITVPAVQGENQLGFVYWGDETQEYWQEGLTHTYKKSGVHTVTIEIRSKKHVPITGLEDGMTINLRELRK